jgi:hypothetical protein
MINKLYKLKKMQTNQQMQERQQILSNISTIDNDVELTLKNISSATVQTIGAISDFKILEIHKNTMRNHIFKLNQQKSNYLREVERYNKIILELNKETEQFKYIKQQQEKEKFKKLIKDEEEAASEYVQSKWMAS